MISTISSGVFPARRDSYTILAVLLRIWTESVTPSWIMSSSPRSLLVNLSVMTESFAQLPVSGKQEVQKLVAYLVR